jgi:iron complex outermembrane recepter protein
VRGLAAVEWSHYRGEQFFLSSVAALPPKLNYHNFGPPWTNLERMTVNTGVLVDATLNAWSLTATTFYADHRRSPADGTLIVVRPDRMGEAIFNRTNDQHSRSLSSEAVAAYRFASGTMAHTLNAAVRNRRSRVNTITLAPISLGQIDLTRDDDDGFGYGVEPIYPVPARGARSHVDHLTGSVGYTMQLGQALELRGGLHRSRYDKTVTSPLNLRTERLETRWLYNASAVLAVRPSTTLYANTVKGIEETGIAPQNARNRDEVLPPVVAEQVEVGVREALTPKLALSVAGFEVKKMIPGLRADGVFTLVGDVRHRGAELSLTGEVAKGTTIVLGALAMKPKLSRPGAAATKPVGVSSEVAVASLNHALDWMGAGPGWSVDARLTWQSPRVANAAGTFKTRDIASLTLGTRYEFKLGAYPAQFRLVAVNAGTSRPWTVGTSGILTQTDPFRIRASLRVTFL